MGHVPYLPKPGKPRRRPYTGRKSASQIAASAGGYRFVDSGDAQGGVWSENERAQEAARRRAQEAE